MYQDEWPPKPIDGFCVAQYPQRLSRSFGGFAFLGAGGPGVTREMVGRGAIVTMEHTVHLNYPLAGANLTFSVTARSVQSTGQGG